MRPLTLLPTGLVLVLASAFLPLAAEEPKPEAEPQPSKESFVKVRVEVELRGILRHTEKGATITVRDRIYDLYKDSEPLPYGEGVGPYALDFSRAKDLRELSKALSGKEVVIIGIGELRRVVHKVATQPGGSGFGPGSGFPIPTPTWNLRSTIEVTRLTLPGEK